MHRAGILVRCGMSQASLDPEFGNPKASKRLPSVSGIYMLQHSMARPRGGGGVEHAGRGTEVGSKSLTCLEIGYSIHWRGEFVVSLKTLAMGLLALWVAVGDCAQEGVELPVPRPEPLLGMNTGGGFASYIISSHLQTGWARYLETVPAVRLKYGIGNWTSCQKLRTPDDTDRILGALHEYGFGVFRQEIGWGSTEYRDDLAEPMRLTTSADAIYRATLRAAKRHGFRLIVLLNAHQGQPCAVRSTPARFAAPAKQGDTHAALDIENPDIIRVGYSGINGLTHYCAAEGLFKAIEREPARGPKTFRVTLGKRLPNNFEQGKEVWLTTLQYRPFGDPGTDEETYRGWGEYADLLARIASKEGLRDGEVHFEIWNEMTFGTSFLSISNYDDGLRGEYDANRMLEIAAKAIRQYFPAKTDIINGFANTSFFFGGFWGSARPSGVNAESYHPYGNQWRSFPEFAQGKQHWLREAYRNADGFVPKYGVLFPEYKGNYIDSHDLIPLMQPEMRELLVAEKHAPPGWKRYMTENGLFLIEVNAPEPYATRLKERAEHYVAKYWLRLYPFYLNKGLEAICDGSLRNPGVEEESWEQRFVETGNKSHLNVLLPLKRLAQIVAQAEDVPLERLIQLRPRVWQLTGQEKVVFGTEGAVVCTELPKGEQVPPWDPNRVELRPLTYRDVFCMLPFQIDDSTLAIGVYVQTRNILEDVEDAGRYQITFPDLKVSTGGVRVYDPLADREMPADIAISDNALSVTLTLSDYPVWMIVQQVDGPRGLGPLTATVPEAE